MNYWWAMIGTAVVVRLVWWLFVYLVVAPKPREPLPPPTFQELTETPSERARRLSQPERHRF